MFNDRACGVPSPSSHVALYAVEDLLERSHAAAEVTPAVGTQTASICDAVAPVAPARAIARAVAMLVGDMTTPLPPAVASGSASSRRYRASPKALMSAAVRLASATRTGARATADCATARPASGAPETATHGVPS